MDTEIFVDPAVALVRIKEAFGTFPEKIPFSAHAREEMGEANATFEDVLCCVVGARQCRRSEDGPNRWVVEGVDIEGEKLEVVVRVKSILGRGVCYEVITVF